MKADSESSRWQAYVQIATAVSAYWVFSIGLVFLNKLLLSEFEINVPYFITWFQCLVSVILCYALSTFSCYFPALLTFPRMSLKYGEIKKVLPLSIVFVSMIVFNNLCLQTVGISFYYLGRSLTTVFSVVFSYIVLGILTSNSAKFCCFIIVFGFLLGVVQENASVSGSLPPIGVINGILASVFVALNAIYTKGVLPSVNDCLWRLAMYNNFNALLFLLPIVVINGEHATLFNSEKALSLVFWLFMALSGIFGFMMGYVTGWQIKVTSPLTHNISGTAKAAAQTLMAVAIYSESKPFMWWVSNVMVLFGSSAYTYVQKRALDKKVQAKEGVV